MAGGDERFELVSQVRVVEDVAVLTDAARLGLVSVTASILFGSGDLDRLLEQWCYAIVFAFVAIERGHVIQHA